MTPNKTNKSRLLRFFSFNFFFLNKLKRVINYYWLRLARLPGSTYAISAGFACGSMVSFTPLLGLHFFLAVIFAFLIRGNFIASLLGTAIGNPISFPFIWGLIYNIGAFVTSKSSINLQSKISVDLILNETYEVFIPMLIGGAIIAIPVWLLTYFIMYSLIASYKKTKKKNN
ncbi:DUF2062 domain-containing protein [Alphaproteobacteria bacterium]|nr:DUF2062 domain-containing protein [Alphaproteobacteria bacterium]